MTTLTSRLKAAVTGLRTGGAVAPASTKAVRGAGGAVRLWPDYRNTQPLWSMTDIQSFIDYGFSANAVIYAACMYRADAVNTAQLKAYRGSTDDPDTLPPTDPLARLLLRPNKFQSSHEFHALNSVFFAVAGQSYVWFKRPRSGALPTEMYTLRPDWVKIVPSVDKGGEVIGYVYIPAGESLQSGFPLLPEDVMHIKRPNPNDPLMGAGYGFSPFGPLAQSANVDNDVTKFLKIFFQSGAMFQNAISFEGSHDKEELAAVRERLKEIYGGVENWNEWGVFDNSAKVQRVSPTFEEMGFEAIDSRNEARILMALGVPPILVGSRFGLERATYSNMEEARRGFWEDRLLPELRMFESEYQFFLTDGDKFVKYDLSDVPALRKDIAGLTKAAKDLVDMGTPPRLAYMTVGLDVPAYDGDMDRYVNVGGGSIMTPVGAAATAEEATETVEGEVVEAVPDTDQEKARKVYDPVTMGIKMDTLAVNWEKRYGDKAVELFQEEQRAISAMLNESQKAAYREKATIRWDKLLKTIEQWYEDERPAAWREAFVPLIQGTMTEAGKDWAAVLGVSFNVRNIAGEAWFQEYLLKFAQPINENSAKAIHDVIAQGMAEGWSIPQTDDHLEQLFQQWMTGDVSPEAFEWLEARMPDYRREAIARTESLRAANAGSLNLGRSWGAKRKFWIRSNDDRVRDSHLSAGDTYTEKNAIAIDDTFNVNGSAMNAPGDPSAPASEVVNCRCTLGLLMD